MARFRLIHPYRPLPDSPEEISRVACSVPIWHVVTRYSHHATASGYDRIRHYVGRTLHVSARQHFLGETLLRVPALLTSKLGGQHEHSRYDYVIESAAIDHMGSSEDSVYHFVYGEKTFRRAGRARKRKGAHLVATLHHPPEHYEWLFRDCGHLRNLSHAVVLSQSHLEFAEGLVGRGKVTVIPHGVDTGYFHPVASVAERSRLRCLFCGTHERDFETLSSVVRGVLGEISGVEFLLLSSDPRCRDVADSHPRAQLLPRLTDADYLELLRSCDLLVLPLNLSTANNAVLEALACGVPVISTVGGVSDYVSAECGALVSVGDSDAMTHEAIRLLADHGRRRHMAVAARQRALQFDWQNTASAFARCCERVARASGDVRVM